MIKAMIPLMRPSPFGARIVNVTSRLGRLNGRRNVSASVFLFILIVLLTLVLLVHLACSFSNSTRFPKCNVFPRDDFSLWFMYWHDS